MRQIKTASRIIVIASLCLLLLPIGAARSSPSSPSARITFINLIKDGAIDGLNRADAAVVSPGATQGVPLGAAFTYQGSLKNNGSPVHGVCDMAFRLYDDPGAGNSVGSFSSWYIII